MSAPHVGHQYGPNMTRCHVNSIFRCFHDLVTCNSWRFLLTSCPAIHILMSPFDNILFNFFCSIKYSLFCRAIILYCPLEMWGPYRYPQVRYLINEFLQSLLSCDCVVIIPQTILRDLFWKFSPTCRTIVKDKVCMSHAPIVGHHWFPLTTWNQVRSLSVVVGKRTFPLSNV